MQAGPSSAREARSRYRHELRTLTYVTLDQANGGIVRNLTHDGITVQAVAAVRPRQQLRVRFELRYPRLRVDTRAEVVWSTFAGRCGIRFLNLPAQTARQIDEWIFGNLLEGLTLPSEREESMFVRRGKGTAAAARSSRIPAEAGAMSMAGQPASIATLAGENNVIELQGSAAIAEPGPAVLPAELDWLSQPLSGRGLVWTVNALVVVAALLLFALVFLSVAREAPKWPGITVAAAAILVATLYWGFFRMFGGASLGVRLARMAESNREEEEAPADRFR